MTLCEQKQTMGTKEGHRERERENELLRKTKIAKQILLDSQGQGSVFPCEWNEKNLSVLHSQSYH